MLSIRRKRWSKHRLSKRKVDCQTGFWTRKTDNPVFSITISTVANCIESIGIGEIMCLECEWQSTLRPDNRCLDHRFRGIESIIKNC